MTVYFCPSTAYFYDDQVCSFIPDDVVEYSAEERDALLAQVSHGRRIVADPEGYPVLVDPPAASLAELQASAWELIKAERDRRKKAGFNAAGKWVHSDTFSRSQWLGLKDNARDTLAAGGTMADGLRDDEDKPIIWKMLDGSFVPVTAQLAFDVVAAVTRSDMAVFTAAETHNFYMRAAADPSAYDYTTAWPQSYAEWAQIQDQDPETIPPEDPEPES